MFIQWSRSPIPGNGIQVKGILANKVEYASTLANFSFTLDNQVVGTFVHPTENTEKYQYNVTCKHSSVFFAVVHNLSILSDYENMTMSQGRHTLQMANLGTDLGEGSITGHSLALVDYVVLR